MFSCDICDKQFRDNFKLKRHKDTVHNEAEKLPCDTCGKSFHYDVLLTHKKERHRKGRLNCDLCEKSFASSLGLKGHVLRFHENYLWRCKYCKKLFASEAEKTFHEENSHPSMKCDQCEGTFKKGSIDLRKHMKIKHLGITHNCDVCGKSFISDPVLRNHLKSVHSDKTDVCDICKNKFSSKYSLDTHKKMVHEQVRATCDFCGQSVLRKCLYAHIKSVHGKNLPCDICGKVIRKVNMKEHINSVHYQIKRFKCDICGKGFPKQCRVDYHKNAVHLMIKIKCDLCTKEYTSADVLKNHKIRDHINKSETCKICWRAFSNKEEIRLHLKNVHFDTKCEFCDKVFPKGSIDLSNHVKVSHLGMDIKRHKTHKTTLQETKILICEHCTKPFKTYKGWKSHKATHLTSN